MGSELLSTEPMVRRVVDGWRRIRFTKETGSFSELEMDMGG